jgi:CrcB protein
VLIAFLLVGGAVGAPLRYVLDGAVEDRLRGRFPWGTFVVNVTGSLVLGVVTGLALEHGLGPVPRVALGTGFCGAYTTFSTYSYETHRLLEDGDVRRALGNALGSVVVGLAAAAAGLAVTGAL